MPSAHGAAGEIGSAESSRSKTPEAFVSCWISAAATADAAAAAAVSWQLSAIADVEAKAAVIWSDMHAGTNHAFIVQLSAAIAAAATDTAVAAAAAAATAAATATAAAAALELTCEADRTVAGTSLTAARR